MLKAGDMVRLAIEKPVAGGRMIARANGQVVLVGGAIPGERVTARIERVARGVAHAGAVSVDEASPDRRSTFADPLCGGCLYAHIAYPRQLALKAQVIADAFARIGRIRLPADARVAPSPEEAYRMRARLHARGGRVGFFREGTHELCDPRATRQLLPATCDALERLAAGLRSLRLDAVREIELSENVDASERVVHLDASTPIDPRTHATLASTQGLTPGPYVTDALSVAERPIKLRRHVLAFFQGNRFLLGDLVAHVAGQVPAGAAVLDLYAGAGLFSIAAATVRNARVTAVEGDRFGAADLDANVRSSGAPVTAVHQAVETFVGPHVEADTIIVDPPRTGMSKEALDGVAAIHAPRLIYVSCDVPTLARDARRLLDAGYAIERIDAFDMFPNTPHVETVVILRCET